MGRWLTFPASRFPERVIGIGFFNRLPVAVLNVAGPWPASAHLTRKLDHLENTMHDCPQSNSLWVFSDKKRAVLFHLRFVNCQGVAGVSFR